MIGPALVLALAAAMLMTASASADDFVPFGIPARATADSLLAMPSRPVAPDSPRVVARDGTFLLDGQRYKVWGVNLCFGANLPRHEDAGDVARRLAEAGVNSVRLHHLDTQSYPAGIWDPQNPRELSAEALDRLDYFVDQLARRGVRVNLNLHVGRAHSRFLDLPAPPTKFDKIVDLFTPALVDAQKDYARRMLDRVNAYRKVRYADDAAVAFVEISNEDSFFMWDGDEQLRALPPYYAGILAGQYNDWLRRRYGTTDRLRKAWEQGEEPLAEANLLKELSAEPGDGPWRLQGLAGCEARLERAGSEGPAVLVRIAKTDGKDWHVQLLHAGLALKAGRYYTLTFRARSDRPRAIQYDVRQAHEPWSFLGLRRQADLGAEWREVRAGFVASADEDAARVTFDLGESDAAVEIADVALRTGGQEGVRAGESIEDRSVAWFAPAETPSRTRERARFLAETEKAFFDGMRSFVQKDLGCKALVTGTQAWNSLALYGQSGMDYVDMHGYWQHPKFPGRPWDPANWLVEQRAMVDAPSESTLLRIAPCRLAGKPFTVSEYNHPAPNDYQAECVPALAAVAALQDWDGVWLFAYCHRKDDWDPGRITSFFDLDANPAKWGFIRAGAAIFLQGGLPPLAAKAVIPLAGPDDPLAEPIRLTLRHRMNMTAAARERAGSLSADDLLRRRLFATFGDETSGPLSASAPAASGSPTWRVGPQGRGILHVAGPGARVLAGWSAGMEEASGGAFALDSPDFAALVLAALDGRPLEESRQVLLAACGRCENAGMGFSKDRRTVGRDWGEPPARIEAVRGRFRLPAGKWRCQALAPDGRPAADVPVENSPDGQFIRFSKDFATMWYLLTPAR